MIKKTKNTKQWTCVINDYNGEEFVGTFCKKELQKVNQKEFRIERAIKRKDDKLYVKCKGYNNSFNSWVDKKDLVSMSEYFPEQKSSGRRVKVEVHLSNYETNSDLKKCNRC